MLKTLPTQWGHHINTQQRREAWYKCSLNLQMHVLKYGECKITLRVLLSHGCNRQRMTLQHPWLKTLRRKIHKVLKKKKLIIVLKYHKRHSNI